MHRLTVYLFQVLVLGFRCGALKWEFEYDGNEYFFTTDMYLRFDWYDARGQCMAEGGDLITIETTAEDDWIGHQSISYNGNYWIGLNNVNGGGTWKWADHKTSSVDNWYANEPGENEMCAYRSSKGNRNWHSENCGQVKGFICKRMKGVVTPKTTEATKPVGGYCPHGWVDSGTDRCYKTFRLGDEKLKWSQAQEMCKKQGFRGAHLACANTESEVSTLTIIGAILPRDEAFWIGLYRSSYNQQNWKWTDNTLVRVENFHDGYTEKDQGCGFLSSRLEPAGSWDADGYCLSLKNGFICQILKDRDNIISTPGSTVPHQCLNGYIPFRQSCYKFKDVKKTYLEANKICGSEGSKIVDIHSSSENAAVQYILAQNHARRVWIGLEYNEEDHEHKWNTGWYVNYVRWGPGQPTGSQGGGCVAMQAEDSFWFDTSCSEFLPFICKTTKDLPITEPPETEGRCPSNEWFPFGGHCYFVCPSCAKKWVDQQNECRRVYSKARLPSIHNDVTNHKLYQSLKDSGLSGEAWLGLHVSKRTGQWIWADGTELQYTNWAKGEPPEDPSSPKVCAFMSFRAGDEGIWKSSKCEFLKGRLCQMDKIPNLPTPSSAPGDCPTGEWFKYESNCYLFRPDEFLSWNEAREQCITEGNTKAYLTSIYTWSENDFIHRKMQEITHLPEDRNFWIGLSKKDDGKLYKWMDGSELNGFTHWELGKPSVGVHKDCGQFNILSSMWLNENCAESFGYVCKVEVVSFGHGSYIIHDYLTIILMVSVGLLLQFWQ